MKCPTCQKGVADIAEICPHCNADIAVQSKVPTPDIDTDDGIEVDAAGDPMGGAIPSPEQNIETKSPEGIEKPDTVDANATPQKQKGKSQMQYVVIALVCVAAFKFGFFDNLLGLKTRPESQATVQPGKGGEEENDDFETESEDDLDKVAVAAVEKSVEEPKVKVAPVKKAAVRPEEWWFYGKAYDLITLRRVAGVEMYFFGADGDITAKTNAKGEYKVKLPILNGVYEMIIDRAGYGEGYLVDGRRAYRSLPQSERSKLWGRVPKKAKWKGTQAEWKRMDLVLFPLASGD